MKRFNSFLMVLAGLLAWGHGLQGATFSNWNSIRDHQQKIVSGAEIYRDNNVTSAFIDQYLVGFGANYSEPGCDQFYADMDYLFGSNSVDSYRALKYIDPSINFEKVNSLNAGFNAVAQQFNDAIALAQRKGYVVDQTPGNKGYIQNGTPALNQAAASLRVVGNWYTDVYRAVDRLNKHRQLLWIVLEWLRTKNMPNAWNQPWRLQTGLIECPSRISGLLREILNDNKPTFNLSDYDAGLAAYAAGRNYTPHSGNYSVPVWDKAAKGVGTRGLVFWAKAALTNDIRFVSIMNLLGNETDNGYQHGDVNNSNRPDDGVIANQSLVLKEVQKLATVYAAEVANLPDLAAAKAAQEAAAKADVLAQAITAALANTATPEQKTLIKDAANAAVDPLKTALNNLLANIATAENIDTITGASIIASAPQERKNALKAAADAKKSALQAAAAAAAAEQAAAEKAKADAAEAARIAALAIEQAAAAAQAIAEKAAADAKTAADKAAAEKLALNAALRLAILRGILGTATTEQKNLIKQAADASVDPLKAALNKLYFAQKLTQAEIALVRGVTSMPEAATQTTAAISDVALALWTQLTKIQADVAKSRLMALKPRTVKTTTVPASAYAAAIQRELNLDTTRKEILTQLKALSDFDAGKSIATLKSQFVARANERAKIQPATPANDALIAALRDLADAVPATKTNAGNPISAENRKVLIDGAQNVITLSLNALKNIDLLDQVTALEALTLKYAKQAVGESNFSKKVKAAIDAFNAVLLAKDDASKWDQKAIDQLTQLKLEFDEIATLSTGVTDASKSGPLTLVNTIQAFITTNKLDQVKFLTTFVTTFNALKNALDKDATAKFALKSLAEWPAEQVEQFADVKKEHERLSLPVLVGKANITPISLINGIQTIITAKKLRAAPLADTLFAGKALSDFDNLVLTESTQPVIFAEQLTELNNRFKLINSGFPALGAIQAVITAKQLVTNKKLADATFVATLPGSAAKDALAAVAEFNALKAKLAVADYLKWTVADVAALDALKLKFDVIKNVPLTCFGGSGTAVQIDMDLYFKTGTDATAERARLKTALDAAVRKGQLPTLQVDDKEASATAAKPVRKIGELSEEALFNEVLNEVRAAVCVIK